MPCTGDSGPTIQDRQTLYLQKEPVILPLMYNFASPEQNTEYLLLVYLLRMVVQLVLYVLRLRLFSRRNEYMYSVKPVKTKLPSSHHDPSNQDGSTRLRIIIINCALKSWRWPCFQDCLVSDLWEWMGPRPITGGTFENSPRDATTTPDRSLFPAFRWGLTTFPLFLLTPGAPGEASVSSKGGILSIRTRYYPSGF